MRMALHAIRKTDLSDSTNIYKNFSELSIVLKKDLENLFMRLKCKEIDLVVGPFFIAGYFTKENVIFFVSTRDIRYNKSLFIEKLKYSHIDHKDNPKYNVSFDLRPLEFKNIIKQILLPEETDYEASKLIKNT